MSDALGGMSLPWHLTTREFAEVDRVLRPDGRYVMSVIDGSELRYPAPRDGDAPDALRARRSDHPGGPTRRGHRAHLRALATIGRPLEQQRLNKHDPAKLHAARNRHREYEHE